jgi:hypothetical protein
MRGHRYRIEARASVYVTGVGLVERTNSRRESAQNQLPRRCCSCGSAEAGVISSSASLRGLPADPRLGSSRAIQSSTERRVHVRAAVAERRRASSLARDAARVSRRAPGAQQGAALAPDPPTVEEIITVMRHAGDGAHGARMRALIVLLWRAGLRINEALTSYRARHGAWRWVGSRPPRQGRAAPRGRCLCRGIRVDAHGRPGPPADVRATPLRSQTSDAQLRPTGRGRSDDDCFSVRGKVPLWQAERG